MEVDYLREKLQKILQNRADRAVYFKADRSIPYGMAVKVMAEIKGAGVEKIGMVTIPVEEDRAAAHKR